ncbi:MAG: hypothetical protein DRQ88_02565 [Epsilonproteobacteria bacterium]|nr:MAG: hypothetical protein DRQ89_02290 [Campylobacterota bacterium]RLA67551.1 MAG: hypothetical protein DRQ88_02565 [Campylobacterota bacterium]
MDSLSEEEQLDNDVTSLISERIEKISPNRKIFIISNENQSFAQGDFISLLIKHKLVSRALVAKTTDSIAGIKILKIYNLSLWKKIQSGREVQILRGDDSYYQKRERRKKQGLLGVEEPEEDLFDKTIISEDLLEDDNNEGIFDTNHMLSLSIGWFEGLNSGAQAEKYSQLSIQYQYQAWKNLFVGIDFGSNVIKDFPSGGLDTRYFNITPKVKYTFEVFWGLILQPYVGWQILMADSPGAGEDDEETNQDQLQYEVDLVNKSEKSTIAVGITVIQPIVPGWNLKADLGMDILSIGVGLEI